MSENIKLPEHINLLATVPMDHSGKRLDQVLAKLFTDYSRERLKLWILSGACLVDGACWQPKDKVSGGEKIEINAIVDITTSWQPENLALEIVYEDESIIVINKPPNYVVHPGNGNVVGTLVNALLYHIPALINMPRAGIVHRLDKDTSGLMVVAKTLTAHHSLVSQLQTKSVNRTYEAIVRGVLIAGGVVEQPIGRHSRNRIKMAVVPSGKPAITHYRVLERFRNHTHVRVQLETGRTHQIRVHMASINHHIIGDQTYGGRALIPKEASPILLEALRTFPRQALHAKILGLIHPISKQELQWEIPLPADMQQLLTKLREDVNYKP